MPIHPTTSTQNDLFAGPEFDLYFREILPLLIEESDRGAVLLGASQIDDQLSKLFEALLPESVSGKRRKEIFNLTGPFGSLSGKLDVAIACRLLPDSLVTAIHKFRKLRNDVAHKPIAFALRDHAHEIRAVFSLIGTNVDQGVTSIASELMLRNAITNVLNLDNPSKPGERLFASEADVLEYLKLNIHHLEKLEPHRLRWELGVGLGIVCALIAFHKRKLVETLGPNRSISEVLASRSQSTATGGGA